MRINTMGAVMPKTADAPLSPGLPSTGRSGFDPLTVVSNADEPNDAAQMVADALLIPGDKNTVPLAEGYVVTFRTSQPFYGVTHGWHIPLVAIKTEGCAAAI